MALRAAKRYGRGEKHRFVDMRPTMLLERLRGWWNGLPVRRLARRGLAELSAGQLHDIGIRHVDAFRTGQHFFRR